MSATGEYLIDQSIRIAQPPATVYAFLADIQDAEPIPRSARLTMVKEPAGPTAVGTRWHERVRIVPGLWLPIESTVVEADDPRTLAMDFTSRWWSGRLTYEIAETADGSVLRHLEVLRPRPLLRPFTSLIGRRLDRTIAERLADIRKALSSPLGR